MKKVIRKILIGIAIMFISNVILSIAGIDSKEAFNVSFSIVGIYIIINILLKCIKVTKNFKSGKEIPTTWMFFVTLLLISLSDTSIATKAIVTSETAEISQEQKKDARNIWALIPYYLFQIAIISFIIFAVVAVPFHLGESVITPLLSIAFISVMAAFLILLIAYAAKKSKGLAIALTAFIISIPLIFLIAFKLRLTETQFMCLFVFVTVSLVSLAVYFGLKAKSNQRD